MLAGASIWRVRRQDRYRSSPEFAFTGQILSIGCQPRPLLYPGWGVWKRGDAPKKVPKT
jgi:hypothetical protein